MQPSEIRYARQRLYYTHYKTYTLCNTLKSSTQQRMESFTAIPDYSNYLAYIFTQMPAEPESVRWKAGLTLKNNIRTGLEKYSPQVITYLKEVLFSTSNLRRAYPFAIKDLQTNDKPPSPARFLTVALADQAHFIRTTAASVIDWLYRGIGPDNWPEALERLLQMAESDNSYAQEVWCLCFRCGVN